MERQNGTASAVAEQVSAQDAAGLPEISRPAGATPLWGVAAVGLQLALVLLIVHQYEVASRLHFFPVLAVAIGGFAVHVCLPPRFRLGFFCLLSIGVLLFVLGWPNGPLVLGIGGGLIVVCYVPLPFASRVAIICLAALVLAVLRLDIELPFWPVLGSMFMFRLVIYLYELRRDAARPHLGMSLAYFFPLQNVCFLFFPVLDFKTFRESYLSALRWQDAQAGIVFLARGLSHLLAYRIVKYYVLPSPHQLHDLPTLALFIAASYALYLHVSGYFHIITGIFHLFGFRLPRTHHNYFLASSFADIWRRINIPWKEFMAKIFFFPAFFALRGWGTRTAIVVAALWVFFVTWLLHTYQAFWIAGRFPLSVFDAVLWMIVGVLVAVNLLRDHARAGRPRVAADDSLRGAVALAARVVGMFALISFFWSCWSTPGFLMLLRTQLLEGHGYQGGHWVLLGLFALIVVGAVAKLAYDRFARGLFARMSPGRVATMQIAILGAAAVVAQPKVAALLGPEAARKIGELRRESVTPVEAAQAVQGYYEEIADAPVRAGAWLAALEGRPAPSRHIVYTDLSRPADDLLERELIPGWHGEVEGSELTVNRLGMRDRPDRAREKPPGVWRMAVVGSSVVMGYGVGDDETFPRLLEDRLNAPGDRRYEVLNFGTGMSYAIHRHVLIDRKVLGFSPDAIFYVAHQDEFLGPVKHLAKLVANKNELPYPSLNEIVRRAGITAATSWGETQTRLQPHGREIVADMYRSIVASCRSRGVVPVWVYVPMPGVAEPAGLKGELIRAAEEAGFVVLDGDGWWQDHSPREVTRDDHDRHANALGQRLIAEQLESLLRRRPELLGGPR